MPEECVNQSRSSISERFPAEESVYRDTVGELLPRIIEEILSELGFNVLVNSIHSTGVDLEARYEGELVLVAEILNWSISSILGAKRCGSIIFNLQKHNCNRVLIYTVLDDDSLSIITNRGIDVLEIGYQVLPYDYYTFFLLHRKIIKRKSDSQETRRDIKNKIIAYLENKHILLVRSIN